MPPGSNISGFILAGGASSRMGRDKGLLQLGGIALIVRTARLLESCASSVTLIGPRENYAQFGLAVVPDFQPRLGPLGGIVTALHVAEHAGLPPWCLVLACDLPYLTRDWLNYLIQRALASRADVVMPESEAGPEPLCALYHTRGRRRIARALADGVRKVTDGLAGLAIETIPPAEIKPFDSAGRLFKNMNSPEDYDETRAYFAAKTSANEAP